MNKYIKQTKKQTYICIYIYPDRFLLLSGYIRLYPTIVRIVSGYDPISIHACPNIVRSYPTIIRLLNMSPVVHRVVGACFLVMCVRPD